MHSIYRVARHLAYKNTLAYLAPRIYCTCVYRGIRVTPSLKYLVVSLAAVLLAGCIDYSEVWSLHPDGSGTISITCSPSSDWHQKANSSNWLQTVQFFMPPFHSISQACARSGLSLVTCSLQRQTPSLSIVFAFDSIRQVSRCSLFADRLLQISPGRNRITFLHKLHTTETILPSPNGHPWSPAWLENSSVAFRIVFPGSVMQVEGAVPHGRYVVHKTDLNKIFSGDQLLIIATARISRPAWFWPGCVLLVCLLPIGLYVLIRFSRARYNR